MKTSTLLSYFQCLLEIYMIVYYIDHRTLSLAKPSILELPLEVAVSKSRMKERRIGNGFLAYVALLY